MNVIKRPGRQLPQRNLYLYWVSKKNADMTTINKHLVKYAEEKHPEINLIPVFVDDTISLLHHINTQDLSERRLGTLIIYKKEDEEGMSGVSLSMLLKNNNVQILGPSITDHQIITIFKETIGYK